MKKSIAPFLVLTSCLLIAACTCSSSISIQSTPLLTASGVKPSVVTDNHGVLRKLADTSLSTDSLVNSDSGRQMLTLLVACAFDSMTTITMAQSDGTEIDFFGETGLAPEWKNGPLSEKGRFWVSSCVLAHLSAEGLAIPISIRGPNPIFAVSRDEREGWPIEEGAFFGNIFTAADCPIEWFACRGSGEIEDPMASGLLHRLCTKEDPMHPGLTLCGFIFRGDCSDICQQYDGRYQHCRAPGGEFQQVITSFVIK